MIINNYWFSSLPILLLFLLLWGCGHNALPSDSEWPAPNQVVIKRDKWGMPHIYAADNYALFFGYGYALAQDRLYQLEILKHTTQGRVAEVLGSDYVDFDRQHRTLFEPQAIHIQLRALATEQKAIFTGMAAGLNYRLQQVNAQASKLLPIEFIKNDFRPEIWTDYDVVMLYVGSMLLRYGDFNTELENQQFLQSLIKKHGEKTAWLIFDAVNPLDKQDAPTTIAASQWQHKKLAVKPGALPATVVVDVSPPATAFSNALVIGKKRLTNAKSVLVNGPQFGWYVPAYTYSVGFHSPEWEAVGNAPVGYPLPMFGYNQHITWGSTWGAGDNVDIFRETLNPDNHSQYMYKGQWRSFAARTEEIKVKGGESVRFTPERSVHGPVVHKDDMYAYSKSRGWTGRELATLIAWIEATQAKNHSSWLQAVKKSALNVNWYFADKKGNIAYISTGAYPKRAFGHDNRLPVSGTGDMDWQGFRPATTNPQVLNPASGYIANWNNKPGKGFVNPDEWWYAWFEADRIKVLSDLMAKKDKMQAEEAWDMIIEAAYIDPNAAFFKPLMLLSLSASKQPKERQIATILRSWDDSFKAMGISHYKNPAVAIFRTWLGNMLAEVLADDLSGEIGKVIATATGYGEPQAPTAAGTNISVGLKVLYETLQKRSGYDFLNGQDPNYLWLKSLAKTISQLSRSFGNDVTQWHLPIPPTRFRHENFLNIPQTLPKEQFDSVHDMNRGTENNMTIFTGADYPLGYEVVPPGQSGFIAPTNIKDKHYADQIDLFKAHKKRRVWLKKEEVDKNSESKITLQIPAHEQ